MSKAGSSLAQRIKRVSCRIAARLCRLVAILVILLMLLQLLDAFWEVVIHIAAGWFFFLRDHIARLSMDAGTWLPGVIAFLLAIGTGHLLLRARARSRGGAWPLGASVALALVVPVTFVISFLVPGVILQVKELYRERPDYRQAAIARSTYVRVLSDLNSALVGWAVTKGGEGRSFPSTLSELDAVKLATIRQRLAREIGGNSPVELPAYLGAGFQYDPDSRLPLLVSPPLPDRRGNYCYVVTIGGASRWIRQKEAEIWMQRSLDAKVEMDGLFDQSP